MMFGFFVRRLVSSRRSSAVLDSNSELGIFPCDALFTIRCFSSTNTSLKSIKEDSFAVLYLINSCGLSLKSAKSISKYVHFETPSKPDSVVSFLRDHGLTDNHISKLVRRKPQLLVSDVNKTVLPKLELLCSTGVSRNDIPEMISRNPDPLSRSLEKHLIPCYDILRSFLLSDEKAVRSLKRLSSIQFSNLKKNLPVNLSFLQGLGVSRNAISVLIINCPNVLCQSVDKLDELVKKIIGMGVDPLKFTFANAIQVKMQMSSRMWEHKIDAFRRWGLSEDEILSAFKKHPLCFILSAKTITKKMDFLVSKMGWQSALVAKDPIVLCYSLEKRIIPRCSVLRVLLLKGLVKEEISLSLVVVPSQKSFLDKFVIKYQEVVPQLLNVFQGKTNLEELGCGFDDKYAA